MKRKQAHGLHEERCVATAKGQFLRIRGAHGYVRRALEIEKLPIVEWKGKALRTIRCTGTTGKGPHLVHVQLSLLWSLIDLRAFRCPYHA